MSDTKLWKPESHNCLTDTDGTGCAFCDVTVCVACFSSHSQKKHDVKEISTKELLSRMDALREVAMHFEHELDDIELSALVTAHRALREIVSVENTESVCEICACRWWKPNALERVICEQCVLEARLVAQGIPIASRKTMRERMMQVAPRVAMSFGDDGSVTFAPVSGDPFDVDRLVLAPSIAGLVIESDEPEKH